MIDIWIDTYVGMKYAKTTELSPDASFDFVVSMVSKPTYDEVTCTPTPIDHPVTGADRAESFRVDCPDGPDDNYGDDIVTVASQGDHLVYIDAFSGTHGDKSLEMPIDALALFYNKMVISFAT